jgi:hypothetical protein
VKTGTYELVGNRTYKPNVQFNIDISTTGNRISRLNRTVSEIVLMITTAQDDPYHRRRGERLDGKNISIRVLHTSYYGTLTWRLLSTSGIWLTGTFTVGSTNGMSSGAPA